MNGFADESETRIAGIKKAGTGLMYASGLGGALVLFVLPFYADLSSPITLLTALWSVLFIFITLSYYLQYPFFLTGNNTAKRDLAGRITAGIITIEGIIVSSEKIRLRLMESADSPDIMLHLPLGPSFQFFLAGLMLLSLIRMSSMTAYNEIAGLIGLLISVHGIQDALIGGSNLLPAGYVPNVFFLFLFPALLSIRSDRGMIRILLSDSYAGFVGRRMILIAFLFPLVAENIIVNTYIFEFFQNHLAPSVFALSAALMLSGFVLWNVRILFRMEEARISEEKSAAGQEYLLHGILDNSPSFIYAKDLQGKYVFVNKVFEKLVGRNRQAIISRTDNDLFPSDVAQNFRENDLKVLHEDRAVEFEEKASIDGKEHVFISSKFPVKGGDGITAGTCGISADVTELRFALSNSQEKEAFLSHMIDALTVGIILFNREGIVIRYNQAACSLFGLSSTSIPFRTISISDAMIRRLEEVFELKTYHINREIELSAGTGNRKVIQYSAIPVFGREQDFMGALLVGQDITAVREREEKTLQDKQLIQGILDNSPSIIYAKNPEGRILFVNNAAVKVLGLRDPAEAYNTHTNAFVPEEYADNDRKVLTTGAILQTEERIQISGKEHTFLTTKFPLYNSSGTAEAVCGISTDITERREYENLISRINENLEGRVLQRTLELEKSNKELEQEVLLRERAEREIKNKNKDLETLLYITSHDLREPLRAVKNFSQIIGSRYEVKLDEQGRDFLNRVILGAQRMEKLLDDILLLSRAQRTIQREKMENAAEIVHEVIRRLENVIQQKNASVRTASWFPEMPVDRIWTTQALYNLVANALKFTKEGQPPDISIEPYESETHTGFVVKDNGPGVDPAQKDRIFQLFQRGVGREVEGTGTGLAIVRQVAEKQGGNAWVENNESGGSVFYLTCEKFVNSDTGKSL